MLLRIQNFLGEFPKIHNTKLKDVAADIAQNVGLDSGALKPLYAISDKITLNESGVPTKDVHLWRLNDVEYWLQFKDFVRVIRSPIADDQYRRIYWSGDSRDVDGHVLFSYTPVLYQSGVNYPVVWYKLGIPAPTVAATITSNTNTVPAEELDMYSDEQRVYVYTYIGSLGEESAPSPPSAGIFAPHDKSTVVLGNLLLDATAGDGRNIVSKRIYRSLTGSTGEAEYYFLAQIPAAQTTYTDTTDGSDLNTADPLPTAAWDPPRQGMQGLGLTASGVAYGFFEKSICLSEPFYPYAFPRDYELTTQFDVVGIGHYDSYIVAATKGTPVIVSGIDPQSMSMLELPLNESCIASRSIVSMSHCVIYASPNGLVMAYNNTAKLVTESFFDKDTWSALNPSSIHAVEHRGKYLFFYDSGSKQGAYLFDPMMVELGIVHLDIHAVSTYRDHETDTLYLLQNGGKVQIFDDVSVIRKSYQWKSKKFEIAKGVRFLAARVIADSYINLTFNVYADDVLLYTKTVTSKKPFRLPNHSDKVDWQIEIISTDTVRSLFIGETMYEVVNAQ